MSSVALLIIISALTSVQLFGFGFQFAFLLLFIGRALYLGRLVGVNLSMTFSFSLEGAAFLWLIVRPILLQSEFKKTEFIVYIIIFLIVALIQAYNESSYVYQEMTEEEYNEHLYKTKVLGDESFGRVNSKNHKRNNRTRKTNKHNVTNGSNIHRRH